MLAAKIVLVLLGVSYIGLAVWCMLKPSETSQTVGFQLLPGSGQSEYLTVYGGLQLGIGLYFLAPLFFEGLLVPALCFSTIAHGSIVLCRMTSFVLFTGIQRTTMILAVVEIVILIASAICWWLATRT